ncbi:lytic polysaccharide monooxygenase [Aquimarina gracilis]|uniref:Lytic polysaccharide monooxygenase n=1 Tax=Aquimarina gracilis TaxID=874422 RepID=A0ABU5ZWB8_9FLAO|nr:lytic polysaccharide monooxygenase [Aquimarina gracilis]MEB3346160.1 lytic polysaccharide monooxygenase [Aquimarina gracilis]
MKKIKVFLFFLFLISLSKPVFSHGTVIWPPSRIYHCYNNPSTGVCQPCGDAIYNWMGVLQPDTNFGKHSDYVPDGQIASGGNGGGIDFSCLDVLTTAWSATRVNHGYIDVKWENTAPHKTQYYKVYITPLGWDPTKPLRWNELLEIGHVGPSPATSFTIVKSFIPDSYIGKRAALVSVWQRDYNESHEAFYSVSDILVNGQDGCITGDTVGVTFTNTTNCTLQYFQNNVLQGSANAGDSYTTNTIVGSQWQAREVSGNLINNFTVICDQSTYASTGTCVGNGGDGCDGLTIWLSMAIYVGGDRVSYNGIEYEAKWWTKGNNPEQFSGPWEVWKNIGDCTSVTRNRTSIKESFTIKSVSSLFENVSIINYQVDSPRRLTMTIRNLSNQTVLKLFENEPTLSGEYEHSFNTKSLSPGIYLCILEDHNGALASFKIIIR